MSYVNNNIPSDVVDQWQRSNTNIAKEPSIPMKINFVQPSLSKGDSARYFIPKISQGIQSNKLNELAAKVSPPERSIFPKPPNLPRQSPPRNISGSRTTQKKKK